MWRPKVGSLGGIATPLFMIPCSSFFFPPHFLMLTFFRYNLVIYKTPPPVKPHPILFPHPRGPFSFSPSFITLPLEQKRTPTKPLCPYRLCDCPLFNGRTSVSPCHFGEFFPCIDPQIATPCSVHQTVSLAFCRFSPTTTSFSPFSGLFFRCPLLHLQALVAIFFLLFFGGGVLPSQ